MATSKNQEREAREARDRLKAYNARQAVHSHQVKRRRLDNVIAGLGVLLIAAAATGVQVYYFTGGPGAPTPAPSNSASAAPQEGQNVGNVPDKSVAEGRIWTGEMTLNDITLGLELDGAAAPQAVASFVTDAQTGYFTGKTCHRMVISDSAGLLQCGSEDGTGASSTDYSFGPVENAPADGLYKTGYLAMARTDSAYGNGHQFFIVFADTTLPDPTGYTVLGRITSGLDALVTKIATPGIKDGASDGAPVVPTSIGKVTVK